MSAQIEKTIGDIHLSMSMENMPLTEEDKNRLRDCLTGKTDMHEVLRQTIARHTQANKGNGRAAREYFRQLSKSAGYELSFEKITADELLAADIAAFEGDAVPLVNVLKRAVMKNAERLP